MKILRKTILLSLIALFGNNVNLNAMQINNHHINGGNNQKSQVQNILKGTLIGTAIGATSVILTDTAIKCICNSENSYNWKIFVPRQFIGFALHGLYTACKNNHNVLEHVSCAITHFGIALPSTPSIFTMNKIAYKWAKGKLNSLKNKITKNRLIKFIFSESKEEKEKKEKIIKAIKEAAEKAAENTAKIKKEIAEGIKKVLNELNGNTKLPTTKTPINNTSKQQITIPEANTTNKKNTTNNLPQTQEPKPKLGFFKKLSKKYINW